MFPIMQQTSDTRYAFTVTRGAWGANAPRRAMPGFLHGLGTLGAWWRERRAFRDMCEAGDLRGVQACMSTFRWWDHLDEHQVALYEGFAAASSHGHLAVAQWLHSVAHQHLPPRNVDEALRRTCQHGHLQVAQWLVEHAGADPHSGDDICFQAACHSQNLQLAKWLWLRGGVKVYAGGGSAWPWFAGDEGDVDHERKARVARWLLSLDPSCPWPIWQLRRWSAPRAAWMRCVAQ